MEEYRANTTKEIAMPELRTTRRVTGEYLCVERNGAVGPIAEVAHSFGIEVQFLTARHDRVTNQFREWYKYAPYAGWNISLFGGATRSEMEVELFKEAAKRYKPKMAVLMAPYGLGKKGDDRQTLRVVDSTRYGDVMGSLWKVGVIGSFHLKSMDGPDHNSHAKTLGGR